MGDFADVVRRHMRERGMSVRATAAAAGYSDHTLLSKVLNGHKPPTPHLAACLDDALGADGEIRAALPSRGPAADPAREVEAIELARRALASDVGDGTCERLELAVDDLATAYPRTPPAELLPRVRAHLGYVVRLLEGRATLAQRRRLLASGGWLSLLTATLLIDQRQDDAGSAYLRTAAQLAAEAGHAGIRAWCAETRAWQLLTAGDYRQAVTLSRAAQEIAPEGSSARIQATAQEGRAWARLGDARQTRGALAAVERLVSALPPPERPEHHYVYDPQKAGVYVATTLAWAGDSAAEQAARDVLAALLADPSPRGRRIALARLDLALALTAAGRPDEAAASALDAVRSGRLAVVDRPRVAEITAAVSARDVPEARELAEAYRAGLAAGRPGES
jgi:tetratricopeptide (TPR) repeat protein/lambda repressor-like predicted transcriptional regulator